MAWKLLLLSAFATQSFILCLLSRLQPVIILYFIFYKRWILKVFDNLIWIKRSILWNNPDPDEINQSDEIFSSKYIISKIMHNQEEFRKI